MKVLNGSGRPNSVRRIVHGTRKSIRMRKAKLYEAGRRCAHDGCISILSVYNKADKCHAHVIRKPPRVRGRDRSKLGAFQ